MTKWEYCAVGPFGPDLNPIRTKSEDINILYLTKDGIVKRKLAERDKNPAIYATRIIAYLGEQGWEMAGSGTALAAMNITGALFGPGPLESHMLYFKRPIEE